MNQSKVGKTPKISGMLVAAQMLGWGIVVFFTAKFLGV